MIAKVSFLSLVINIIVNISDVKLVVELEAIKFDKNQNNLIMAFLASKIEEHQI